MPPRDVSAEVYAIQLSILRAQTPAQKFRAAVEMSDFAHRLAQTGLRERHPDCTDENVGRMLAEEIYPQRQKGR
jgi:hypothetical protein